MARTLSIAAVVCMCAILGFSCSYGPIALDADRAGDASGGDDAGGAKDPSSTKDAGSRPGTETGTPDPSLVVVALTDAAPQWNDYALRDDLQTRCPEDSSLPAEDCVHAGALRAMELPTESSCAGLEVEDERGWFDWTCDDADGAVVVRTTRLRPEIGLRDLIDSAELSWHTNTVIVTRSATAVTTTAAAFWTNPVRALPSASSGAIELDERGAVYVVTETPSANVRIVESAVSLLGASGVELRTAASADPPLAIDTGRRVFFPWLEAIQVDADDHASGIELRQIAHGVVRDVAVTRDVSFAAGSGADLRIDAEASTLTQLASTQASSVGVALDGERNVVSGVTVIDPGGDGLEVRMQDSTLAELRVQGAGGAGLSLSGAIGNTLAQVSVADCDGNGIDFATDSRNDVLADAIVANNGASGILVRGRDQRLLLAISANNEQAGIWVDAANTLLQHTTTTNNREMGLHIGPGASDVQIVNALSTNNQGGLWLQPGSQRTRGHDLWLASNVGGSVLVEGDHNLFTGALAVSGPTTCALNHSPIEPGIASPCDNADGSSATFTVDNVLQSMAEPDDGILAGMQWVSDPLNATVDPVSGQSAYAAISDWLSFSNRFRHWGRPASSGSFPNDLARGRCDATSECAYWDWRVSQRSSRARDPLGDDRSTLLSKLELAAHARTQPWSALDSSACTAIAGARWDDASGCATPFLAIAYEPLDGIDNDDFLCTPDEHCILNRNRGAYPGQGALSSLDPGAADGEVDVPDFGRVTLSIFADNGE